MLHSLGPVVDDVNRGHCYEFAVHKKSCHHQFEGYEKHMLETEATNTCCSVGPQGN